MMTTPAHSERGAAEVGRRALHGSIAGAVSFVASLLGTLVLVPVLLRAWGTERYGLWLALQSLFALLITLDTGHHTYVGNELLRLYPTDRAAARSMLAAGLLGAVLLGGLELGVATVLLSGGGLPVALGQPERALPPGTLAAFALLMVGWVAQGSAGGIWVRLYPAAGQYARSVWWGVAYRLLQTLVIGVAVALGAGIWGAVLASTLMTLGYTLLSWCDARARFADLYPFWRGARPAVALRNLARSMVLTGCALTAQLQQHGVNVLLSGPLGLSVLPAFTTTRTLANVFAQAAGIVTGPLMPEMIRLSALAEHRKLADTVRAIWLVTGAPVNLGLCLGLPVYQPVYEAWTGGAMTFDPELFAWLALAISLRCFGAPFTALIAGLNALRAQIGSAFVQSALVLGSLALAMPLSGLRAAGMAVALGELCGSVLVPVLSVRSLEPELMRRLPWRALLLGALPSALVAGCLLAAARGLAPALLVMAVAVGGATLLYSLQWSELGRPMQDRLLSLARIGRKAPRPG
jgi:O-antigen/teichoic acid export membrane protein